MQVADFFIPSGYGKQPEAICCKLRRLLRFARNDGLLQLYLSVDLLV